MSAPPTVRELRHSAVQARVARLGELDWAYTEARSYVDLHEIHPYPAKFIAEIPRRLIEEFSAPGDLVLDPFCGSGTTMAEAALLRRRSVGVDISPLSALVATVKSSALSDSDSAAAINAINEIEDLMEDREGTLWSGPAHRRNGGLEVVEAPRESRGRFRGIEFWFEPHVLHELSALQYLIGNCERTRVRSLLRVAVSAIVVQVSKQDSDTRYVRRHKDIAPGETTRRFVARARAIVRSLRVLDERVHPRGQAFCADSRTLTFLRPGVVDLVVTSPPYPNAWSYHLYHQNRMLVLGMNPWAVKIREIGSHRAYSAKNGSDRSTFLADMTSCMTGVAHTMRGGALAAVVIGPSIVRGEVVDNAAVIIEAGARAGLRHMATIEREIDSRRKAFNPKIGRIRSESVVLMWKPT